MVAVTNIEVFSGDMSFPEEYGYTEADAPNVMFINIDCDNGEHCQMEMLGNACLEFLESEDFDVNILKDIEDRIECAIQAHLRTKAFINNIINRIGA